VRISGPPILGDVKTASKYIKLGDIALERYRYAESKNYYNEALKASPWIEEAIIGLARVNMYLGNTTEAIKYYRMVVPNTEYIDDFKIEIDYILALQRANQISEAITYYNNALGYCKKGYSVVVIDVCPPEFKADGSDYDAKTMIAMAHLMMALNTSVSAYNSIMYELYLSEKLLPESCIIHYYKAVLMKWSAKPEAENEFKKALMLDNGEYSKVILKRMKESHY
jgi:tetratricopeptide (TPR) repeat protein